LVEGEERPPLLFVLERDLFHDPLADAKPIQGVSKAAPSRSGGTTAGPDVFSPDPEDGEPFQAVDDL